MGGTFERATPRRMSELSAWGMEAGQIYAGVSPPSKADPPGHPHDPPGSPRKVAPHRPTQLPRRIAPQRAGHRHARCPSAARRLSRRPGATVGGNRWSHKPGGHTAPRFPDNASSTAPHTDRSPQPRRRGKTGRQRHITRSAHTSCLAAPPRTAWRGLGVTAGGPVHLAPSCEALSAIAPATLCGASPAGGWGSACPAAVGSPWLTGSRRGCETTLQRSGPICRSPVGSLGAPQHGLAARLAGVAARAGRLYAFCASSLFHLNPVRRHNHRPTPAPTTAHVPTTFSGPPLPPAYQDPPLCRRPYDTRGFATHLNACQKVETDPAAVLVSTSIGNNPRPLEACSLRPLRQGMCAASRMNQRRVTSARSTALRNRLNAKRARVNITPPASATRAVNHSQSFPSPVQCCRRPDPTSPPQPPNPRPRRSYKRRPLPSPPPLLLSERPPLNQSVCPHPPRSVLQKRLIDYQRHTRSKE